MIDVDGRKLKLSAKERFQTFSTQTIVAAHQMRVNFLGASEKLRVKYDTNRSCKHNGYKVKQELARLRVTLLPLLPILISFIMGHELLCIVLAREFFPSIKYFMSVDYVIL